MSNDITWHNHKITAAQRAAQKHQRPAVLWYTGLSGSGKSTIANLVDEKLYKMGYHSFLLDGDNVRHGLNGDLGFSDADRVENIRRVIEVALLMSDAGLLVQTAFISPFAEDRTLAKARLSERMIEIYIDASLSACEARDPKGLYRKARDGVIKNFTGIDSDYDVPNNPDIIVNTVSLSADACAQEIVRFLVNKGWIGTGPAGA
ncbi:TPA: adenylyl-sulfate kinase [Aeromonas veronii]|uniref:adenylyl-sulfate kinase n=1 Tax=Aeromonas TaxID=642 RepID=UPI00084A3402|nr:MULTISPECIES: adenylyl-sulfate kinase [Aeromonas]OEC54972.1 adenylyl-sulfate kinase [Aeromonas sp. ANNP30]OEC65330.1 adenylyl-sulfate kinase [Aeromonas sp. ANP5]SIQ21972.1 adenylylsulfate kinase [Aeromonas veronii]HEA3200182.1 adenylyl-sulfate kinase [Aeromonas veronii]